MDLICGHEGKHAAKGLCSPCYYFALNFLKKKKDLKKQHVKEIKKLKAQLGELGLQNLELLEALKSSLESFKELQITTPKRNTLDHHLYKQMIEYIERITANKAEEA